MILRWFFVLIFTLGILSCSESPKRNSSASKSNTSKLSVYVAPDTSSIPHNEMGAIIRYGLNLIQNTSYFIGPNGSVSKNLGNKMNCTNCHLQNGTKAFGLNFFNTHALYPQFRARENKVLSLLERVNNCIERPHNGTHLKLDSKEMIAIISYIKWIGEKYDVKIHEGHGLKPIEFVGLSANSNRGEVVYAKHCESCHQISGEGLMNSENTCYTYPPLWGQYSYQESSSMHRVLKSASFIKYNMPNTNSWEHYTLTDQEALDVAAFINDVSIHPRPKAKSPSYENITKKPIDYFKGPYLDNFPAHTHAFGPWDGIISFNKENKIAVIY